jgi:hypothetical protein
MDPRYKLIRPRFDEGKIRRLQDIVDIVTKTVLAADIGKNNDSFSRLIDHIEEFVLKDLALISLKCNLTLPEMLGIIKTDYTYIPEKLVNKNERYEYIQPLLKTGDIKTFEDIFLYVRRYIVAPDLGMKRQRLGQLIKQIENFELKDLTSIGTFCNLKIDETFLLVAASYANQKSTKS